VWCFPSGNMSRFMQPFTNPMFVRIILKAS
jgi:hypothetical protein